MGGLSESLGTFAGATGVGALGFLGIFLILDGRASGLLPTVEEFAKTSTWGVVAALPVLAISYLIGLAMVTAGEELVQRAYGPGHAGELAHIVALTTLDASKSVLVQQFQQLRSERAALAGSSLALVFLCCGALSEIRNLPALRSIIRASAVGAVVLALALFHAAGLKTEEAHELVRAFNPATGSPAASRP